MFERRNIENLYRLSPLQGGILYHHLAEPNGFAYHEQFTYRLTGGELELEPFRRAWQELAKRHESLRTVFVSREVPEPLQVVLRRGEIEFSVEDLRGLSDEAQAARLRAAEVEDLERGFDLGRGPLMRVRVFQEGDSRSALIWSFHHIIMDGWCLSVILPELLTVYQGLRKGNVPLLPPAPQYRSYIKWLGRQDLDAARAYWLDYLAGYARPVSLPGKQPVGAAGTGAPAHHNLFFSVSLSEGLQELARLSGLTLNTVFQGLWGLLLCRRLGLGDVVFAATVSGRHGSLPDVEKLVGLCINAVPVRVRVREAEDFVAMCRRLQGEFGAGVGYHHYPLSDLQAESGWGAELFDHILVFENYPVSVEGTAALGLDVQLVHSFEKTNYPLTVQFFPGAQIQIDFGYNPTRLPAEAVEHLGRELEALACAVLEQPAAQLSTWVESRSSGKGEGFRLSIAATFTADFLAEHIEWWTGQFGLGVEVEIAPYNQIFQQLLQADSPLALNQGANLLLVRFEDWLRDARPGAGGALLEELYEQLCTAVSERRGSAPLFVGIFPADPALGTTLASQVAVLNQRWRKFAHAAGIYVLDFTNTAARYSTAVIFDRQQDRIGHLPFTDEYGAALGAEVARALVAWKQPHFKVIAVDADDTLWGGVCSEDGSLGVMVEEGHRHLQEFLLDRRSAGFLLVLVSKNEEADVRAVFAQHPGMVLKWEHFVATQVNWRPKSTNLRSLAAELNLGLDSFIFLDNSGVECAEVRSNCPEVLAMQLPAELGQFTPFLAHLWACDRLVITSEDRQRNQMYDDERERRQSQQAELSFEGFLRGLGLKITVQPVGEDHMARVAQLTQRTNQFNLSNIRRTEDQIRALLLDPTYRCWSVDVEDRFGAYGLAGVVFAQEKENRLELDTLLLSCRVLGRQVEQALLAGLKQHSQARGLEAVDAFFLPTAKNRPCRDFLDQAPWVQMDSVGSGVRYRAPLDRIAPRPEYVALDWRQSSAPVVTAPAPEPAPALLIPTSVAVDWSDLLPAETGLHHAAYLVPLRHPTSDRLRSLPVVRRKGPRHAVHYAAPANRVQKELVEIWEGLLGGAPIGIDDDFFALGGHSIRAVQLVSRVYQHFAVELSLKEIFDHPTVARQAELIRSHGVGQYQPIPSLAPQVHYAVSHGQRRLWVLDQLLEDRSAYNVAQAFWVSGVIREQDLERAFGSLVARHESLRTTFLEVQGQPRQQVHPAKGFAIEVVDYRTVDDGELQAKETLGRAVARPFDLAQGPLLRALLFKIGPDQNIFALIAHHIICDGWSLEVMAQDVMDSYNGQGAVGALTVQYRDFAAWQQERLDQKQEVDGRFWRTQLARPLPVLDLPADFKRPVVRSYKGQTLRVTLDPGTTARLKALAQAGRSTLFMALLAAVDALLHRYTGQTDLVVGSPVAGRHHPDLERQVGFYVNTLALRVRLEEGDSFTKLLGRVREATLAAYEHQEYPFDLLVDELQVPRSTDRAPIFDVLVALQNTQGSLLPSGLNLVDFPLEHRTSRFDLSFSFVDAGATLDAEIEYSTDLFTRGRIERLWDHFATLVQAAAATPDRPLAELELIGGAEAEQLRGFSGGPAVFPDASIAALFAAQAAHAPQATALRWPGGVLSYLELDAWANGIAHHLVTQAEVHPEDIVGVLVEREPASIAALLGIFKAGATYLPLDPAYPPERLAYMIADSGCRVVVGRGPFDGIIPDNILLLEVDELRKLRRSDSPTDVAARQLAYVIYTSGSTGRPKGVMVEHRGFVNMVTAQIAGFGIAPDDRVLQFASPSFDASLSEVFMALLAGACLVLVPRSTIDELASFTAYLEEHAVSVATLPPVYLGALQQHPLPTLRVLITAGEAARPADARHFARTKRYFNAYGPTECSVCVSFHEVDPWRECQGSVPIGRPIANTEVLILDQKLGLAPMGVAGEICVSGVGLARGYLGQTELSAASFVPHPFREGDRLYRTGDVGRWLEDGTLEFIGRRDSQVKIRGHRVEPGEIAACVMEHPGVAAAAVLVREGSAGQSLLEVYAVARKAAPADEDLRAWMRHRLPEYMLPSRVFWLEALPLTANGKLDLTRLAESCPQSMTASPVVPRTAREALIARVWEGVLGCQNVSVHGNFFALGGDSIGVIQVAARLREHGLQLAAQDLFRHPTIAELAPLVTAVSLSRSPAKGRVPLTPIQCWFFARFGSRAADHFNQAVVLKARQRLDPRILREVLRGLQQHHDMLRARYRFDQRGVEQEVVDFEYPLSAEVETVTGTEQVWKRASGMQASANLERGPMLRAAIVQAPDADYLLLVVHHLVVDGVSWRILGEDLERACVQALSGQPVALAARTDSFQQWALVLHERASSPEMQSERAYWESVCNAPVSALPPTGPQEAVGSVELVLDKASTQQVLAGGRAREVLLTALGLALRHWAGGERFLVSVEGHGRQASFSNLDVSRTVGWFTCEYPVLLDLGTAEPGASLKVVQRSLSQVPHDGLGYGILKYLAPTGKGLLVAQGPQVGFNYLGQFETHKEGGLFTWVDQPASHSHPGDAPYPLQVEGLVKGGRLYLTITSRQYGQERLEELAQFLRGSLADVRAILPQSAHQEAEAALPLSPLQADMLRQWHLDPSSTVHHEQFTYRFKGELAVDVFQLAWTQLVERHEALRTVFVSRGAPQPLQLVLRQGGVEFEREDVRGLSAEAQGKRLLEVERDELSRGFNLERGPLLRVHVLQEAAGQFAVVWSFHHILIDGWCQHILQNELFALYEGLRRGEAPVLAPAAQYRNYINWLESQDRETARRYWQEYLSGFEGPVSLPGTRVDAAGGGLPSRHHVQWSRGLSGGLQGLAQSWGVTLSSVFQGLWGVLLCRLQGREEVVFGATVSGRPGALPGVEGLVGLCINAVPVRMRLAGMADMRSLCLRMQAELGEGQAYHYYPMRDEGGAVLFDHVLTCQNYPRSQRDEDGLQVEFVRGFEHFPHALTLQIFPGTSLELDLNYDPGRVPTQVVERLMGELEALALAVLAQPARPLVEFGRQAPPPRELTR